MTKITRTHSAGCNGKGNSMNTRMKALLTTAALMLMAWHPAARAEMSLYYIHNDHLGTPQVVTNEDQNVAWQADYQPFGEVDVTVNTLDQEARFPGQYTDDATGLHYNYFRDYDPSIGRYIQSDPIGLNGGINTYGYVEGNPLKFSDPYGLFISTVDAFCATHPKDCIELVNDLANPPVARGLSLEQCIGDSPAPILKAVEDVISLEIVDLGPIKITVGDILSNYGTATDIVRGGSLLPVLGIESSSSSRLSNTNFGSSSTSVVTTLIPSHWPSPLSKDEFGRTAEGILWTIQR